MPATIVDSLIFQRIFSTDEMRRVWSDENRTQKYLDIEAALARLCDPANYLGQSGVMVDRVLAMAGRAQPR